MKPAQRIAEELNVSLHKVTAAIKLLDEGSTVPFIARYRKEATGGLDDAQLRTLEDRLRYLRELDDQRDRIVAAIEEQGKLSDALRDKLMAAETKARLDDLYLPYKKKRRTRAQKAREAGLVPLADQILANPSVDPESVAAGFLNEEHGVATPKDALDGARQILMERMGEDADLVASLRTHMTEQGQVTATVVKGKELEGAKFRDYFDFSEPLHKIPSHRALALFRARKEGILSFGLADATAPETGPGIPEQLIAHRFGISNEGRPADRWLNSTVRLAWKGKLMVRLELALLGELRARAEEVAIDIFARNLRDLLLAAPAGSRTTLGLDPGLRTGVKVVVISDTGKVLDEATIYPHAPRKQWNESLDVLEGLVRKHGVDLIAVGNGTASRETDKLSADLIKRAKDLRLTKVMVSESGASVYSASALASSELPDMDVSLRGAVSIARRLQDPLAELVKIDPKSIGVGQYQHDVDQVALARSLSHVVEDAVNAVGVDLNTASPSLLQYVAGLSSTLANNIVAWRDEHGAFTSRKQLLKVSRLGPRTYEQCAGFLRIRGGDNPLDASAVHPETYPVVKRIMQATGSPLEGLLGNAQALRRLRPEQFTDDKFGLPTVRDILGELEKPGRDPRPEFKTATFTEGVEELKDLQPGMILEGTVTNVTAFGAFVDVGVHQDGLVHISRLSDRFVKEPSDVVKTGQVVQVKVLEVDLQRKRVSLSMRMDDVPGEAPKRGGRGERRGDGRGRGRDDRRGGRGRDDRRGGRDDRGRRPERSGGGRQASSGDSSGGTLADLFRGGRRR